MSKDDKYVFKRYDIIGNEEAEHDEVFLRECFVDTGVSELIMDTSSKKCILKGRTGSGKSALLWHIKNTADRTIRISP